MKNSHHSLDKIVIEVIWEIKIRDYNGTLNCSELMGFCDLFVGFISDFTVVDFY
jgi:hypothetical protein